MRQHSAFRLPNSVWGLANGTRNLIWHLIMDCCTFTQQHKGNPFQRLGPFEAKSSRCCAFHA